MTGIRFETIRTGIINYKEKICSFLNGLDIEKNSFNAQDIDRILNAQILILAFDNDKIIGFTGITKYLIFHTTYIVVKKEYQSKGIGGFLHLKRKAEAIIEVNLLLSWILPTNKLSLDLNQINGAEYAGKRWEMECYALPLNKKGRILFYLLKLFLLFGNLLDKLRILVLPFRKNF